MTPRMKRFNAPRILFLPLLFLFSTTTSPFSIVTAATATATATPERDVQPSSEVEWSCTHLEVQKDGHTVNYTCAIIAAALDNCDGENTGNNSHTNSSSSSSRQHPAISGSLDLNACVGTTAGRLENGGGRLALERDGCMGNLCRDCSFVATAPGGDPVPGANVEGYPFAGPFGSNNASLLCNQCDSAEGLEMAKDVPALIDVGDFLSFTEDDERGLTCKDALEEEEEEGKDEKKRALRGWRRDGAVGVTPRGGVLDTAPDEPSFVPDEDKKITRRDGAKRSTDDVCASRREAPWTRFQKPLGGAGCDGIQLQWDLHTLRATCDWAARDDAAAGRVDSLLDLNGCLRNAGGNLLPAADGQFFGSCTTCRIGEAEDGADLDGDGSRDIDLSCGCGKGHNLEGTAYAELSSIDVLQVVAGQLMCQGKLGELYTGEGD
ncbi:hypothetical protein F5X99DRAFT_107348 [Biscogniauxia marginata]|nr:hypothetical protein F5X99DRAFT_107348 [Biscogniauxia marginata]